MSEVDATPLGTFPTGLQRPDTQLEPYDWFERCRTEGPVVYDPTRGCYDVFGYETVKDILGDHERFSSDPLTHPNNDEEDLTIVHNSILYQDPPRHDELRSVVDDFFYPGAIKEMTPDIEDLANDLVDEVIEDFGRTGEFDLVRGFAYPLPVKVIAGLLGIPPEDHERFREWSTAIVTSSDPGDELDLEQSQQAYTEMEAYFEALLDDRRSEPRDDLLSRLVTAGDLSAAEMFGFAVLLLAAGNLTTTNLIANAVWSFGAAGYMNAIRSGTVDLELAIEEVLRYRSPVQALHRWTSEDLTLGDHDLAPGTSVVVWINAANRDPAAFEDAESFVPDRQPNPHIAFGHGIHTCLGASLARLEARIALQTLLTRFERLEPVIEELQPQGSVMVYGPGSLPVRYESA